MSETIADRIRAGKLGDDTQKSKIEHIGKVKLDLSKYPGEDFYCDGEIEDTLLEIARERSQVEYQGIIEESANWPILYHLSPLRENIVEWLPMDKYTKVLEVGSGCGAITGALARKAGSVTCCDLSLKRSKINAYRHMDCENVTIHVGNFTDVEADLDRDYDYICLIGVFEYAQAYVDSADPYGDFLKMLQKHCKPNGRIVIAIENKFGLKYWAGCKEDHLATYFSSIEDYPDGGVVRTFTDKGLQDIARRCNFTRTQMFYPYPDYKFMTNLYSEKRLPIQGELKNNLRNMDRDRYQLFDEKAAFDSILKENLFHLYSNSYMFVIGPKIDVDYVRYSNDRMDKYCIATEIATDVRATGTIKRVTKRALCEEAKPHLKEYMEACAKLTKRYAGGKLIINQAHLSEDGWTLELDYAQGVTLESKLDDCLTRGDTEGFLALYKEYLDRIGYGEENAQITDMDLIFSNILIEGDKWTAIDYEWTVPKIKTVKELGFRAIYCYVLEDEKRDKLSLELITDLLGVTEKDAAEYREQEMEFQKKVTGDHKSLDEIREAIGNAVYSLEDKKSTGSSNGLSMKPQLYEDTGLGFNEQQSQYLDGFPVEVDLSEGRKALRIDPCSVPCIVSIKELSWNGQSLGRGFMNFKCNGKKIGNDVYAFATEDPGFTVSLKNMPQEGVNKLRINMQVTPVDIEILNKIV